MGNYCDKNQYFRALRARGVVPSDGSAVRRFCDTWHCLQTRRVINHMTYHPTLQASYPKEHAQGGVSGLTGGAGAGGGEGDRPVAQAIEGQVRRHLAQQARVKGMAQHSTLYMIHSTAWAQHSQQRPHGTTHRSTRGTAWHSVAMHLTTCPLQSEN